MSLRKFESLTAAGKRMRIARDVLLHLDSQQLVAKHDYYINTAEYEDRYLSPKERTNITLSDWIKEGKKCKVCALGAILACKVPYENGITLVQAESHSNLVNNLLPYFTLLQLNMIEMAFEGHTSGMRSIDEKFDRSVVADHRYVAGYDGMGADAILRDIMHNIIANRGEFVPHGKTTPAPVRGKNQHSKRLSERAKLDADYQH